jgi:PAS domain-containing protein
LSVLVVISFSLQNLQGLCAALNRFALPRAIVNFEQGSFVAWNPKFLEQTGLSEEEIKAVQLEELLTIGGSWLPLSKRE